VYISALVGANSNHSNMHGATIKIWLIIYVWFLVLLHLPRPTGPTCSLHFAWHHRFRWQVQYV